ncbi:PIN domain-containing protein [Streptococcus sp. 27098_8_82]|jgi:hypothetical protein|uniref:PIN domain-containing protein n=1 Tax=Streptococcus sp. 27098_8_82 TaxID=3003643 RepID=UPI00352C720F
MNSKINDEIIICLDTNIYHQANYNFDANVFTTFKDLKVRLYPNLKIYVDPIIYREVLSHINDRIEEILIYLNEFNKKALNIDTLNSIKNNLDYIKSNSYSEAKDKFEEFVNFFTNEQLEMAFPNYNMTEILEDYFNSELPFEDKAKKKNEFPDALIIHNLKTKFQNSNQKLIVVSTDKGFIEAVKLKIPHAKQFINYQDCVNYLNKDLPGYKRVRNGVLQESLSIAKQIKVDLSDFFEDLNELYYFEENGITIDVTDYDKDGITELTELDEALISGFEIKSPSVKVLKLDIDEQNSKAELKFKLNIDIEGREEDSYNLICENHKVDMFIDLDVKIFEDKIEVLNFTRKPIMLDKTSRVSREVHRDYFSETYFDVNLQPTNPTYKIICNNCGAESEFFAPDIVEFDQSSTERSMGTDTYYSIELNEICENCSCSLNIEITINEYPYLVLDNQDSNCPDGDLIGLSYEFK